MIHVDVNYRLILFKSQTSDYKVEKVKKHWYQGSKDDNLYKYASLHLFSQTWQKQVQPDAHFY